MESKNKPCPFCGSEDVSIGLGDYYDYAEAWRKEARLIQHHTGQSVVFFKDYRVEFTRLPSVSQP